MINPPGAIPAFEPEDEAGAGLPFYEEGELPQALDYFHLSSADGTLWAAAGPLDASGQLTVAVREEGSWRLVIGPARDRRGSSSNTSCPRKTAPKNRR